MDAQRQDASTLNFWLQSNFHLILQKSSKFPELNPGLCHRVALLLEALISAWSANSMEEGSLVEAATTSATILGWACRVALIEISE